MAKIAFWEPRENDRRTRFCIVRFFIIFSIISRNAFLRRKYVHRRRQGRPRIDFGILKRSSGGGLGAPRAETGGPKPPPKSRIGATGATEGAEELSERALGAQSAILAECVLT